MALTPAQWEQQLARSELRPVYLIAGNEDLLRIEAADTLRKRARELGYAERNVFDVEAGFDWDRVSADFLSMSLFASRRLIELRLPSGKPGATGSAVIEAFCAAPAPDVCLLITANEWSRLHETAWVRRVESAGAFLQLWPLKPAELPQWIARRLKSRGLSADADAAALLAERVEGNLLAAAQEIDKLVLLAEGRPLDLERMASLVGDSARFDVFGLTEAALNGDAARSLRMLRSLRAEGEAVVPVLSWLAGQVQILAQLTDTLERGGNLAQAMSVAKVWESRQSLYRKALNRLHGSDIRRALKQCALIERVSKGRAAGDAWLELERLLLGLAQPRAIAGQLA